VSVSASPQGRMLELTFVAFVVQRAIYAAARLGIADLLADGSRASDEIAHAANADADAMYRLLRALASVDVLTESEGRTFGLTELGETLRSDGEGSMRGWVLFSGAGFYLSAWQEIVSSIETGTPAFPRAHGASFFDYLAADADAQSIFDGAMTSLSGFEARAVCDAYDFSATRTLVDIAGGQGTLLASVLEANPHCRGVLFDQPQTVASARSYLAARGLADRSEVVEGDFFASVPAGADTYLLKYIVHDWDDESAIRILTNCREAMAPAGKVLLAEIVMQGRGRLGYPELSDLEMLVLLGSRERTVEEYETLLGRAGLSVKSIVPTLEHLVIIEAVES
jgi:hypothetical protein